MKIARKISKNFLSDKPYLVMILDVNSLFMFGGKNSIKTMYSFIESVKASTGNNNLLVINVIDNGISNRLLRKFPDYKGNRPHSIQSNNCYVNKFATGKSIKYKTNRIHKIDSSFKSNLTFYLPGESDFKIGQILRFLQERTSITNDEVLTVSFDKDMVLCSPLSDVILKRFKNSKRIQNLIDEHTDIPAFKELLKIPRINIKTVFDFYYFLLINGDSIDNIHPILNKNNTTKLMNMLFAKYGKVTTDLICKHVKEYDNSKNCNDILDNGYLVDIYNSDIYSTNQKNNMVYALSNFLKYNNIRVFN